MKVRPRFSQPGIASPRACGQIALGTLRLPKLPTVIGRVVDSAGHPVTGAQIWGLSAEDLTIRRKLADSRSPVGGEEKPVALAGADGRFAIPRFEPGILEVCGRDGHFAFELAGADGAFRLAFRESDAASRRLTLDTGKEGFTPQHLRFDPDDAIASTTAAAAPSGRPWNPGEWRPR